jgi:peptidylprolyl isomerase
MSQARDGNSVKVHYTGTLDDGTVFDTSDGREPLEFTLGEGHVIPGFENAVRGMSPGETKTATIPAQDAYGMREPAAVFEVSRAQLPADVEPEEGQQLGLQDQHGRMIPAVVTEVTDTSVTIDANHPLAGRDLTFKIELVDVDESK